jgi:hypothetical protein
VSAALRALLGAELDRPAAPAAVAVAAELARIGGAGVRAVLFYGSALRTGALDGVLDFYVLLDAQSDWPQGRAVAAAGAWLPPNVEYRELEIGAGTPVRAKVALLRADQFRSLAGRSSLDTSIWARFAQPAALVWSRDAAARDEAAAAVAEAAATAGLWAARLGPEAGEAQAYWNALFRETYAAELRVEPKGRERAILDAGDRRWGELLPLAWTAAGVGFESDGLTLRPAVDRAAGRRAWRWRRLLGKPLTVLRLAKAVFTFQGAADYAVWKIARHTGVQIEVTPWRRKHPILAAPAVAWTLWKKGVLR